MRETFEGIIEILVLTVYAVASIFMIWLWFWVPDIYTQSYEKVTQAMVKPILPIKHYKVDTIPFGKQPTILPANEPNIPFTEVSRMECIVPEKYWIKFVPCTKYGDYI